MKRRYLKLNETVIPRVSTVVTSEFFRTENRQTTLSGGVAIDRGDPKLSIDVVVSLMSAEEYRALTAILNGIEVTASFYYAGQLETRVMFAEPISAAEEIYPFNKRENGTLFANVRFKMEEK